MGRKRLTAKEKNNVKLRKQLKKQRAEAKRRDIIFRRFQFATPAQLLFIKEAKEARHREILSRAFEL